MTKFAHAHIATWKDGHAANWTGATVIVSHDQTNTAYNIATKDRDAFAEWVAVYWPGDDDIQEDDELTADFLDRCGISIRTV